MSNSALLSWENLSLTFQALCQQLKLFHDLSHSQQTLNFSEEPPWQVTPSCLIITSSVKVWSISPKDRGRMPWMIQKGCSAGLHEQVDLRCWWSWLMWFSIWESGLFKWEHKEGREAGPYRGLHLEPGPVGWLLEETGELRSAASAGTGSRASEWYWTTGGQASPWAPGDEHHPDL